ncbi:hypothetical protein [Phenylobacterium sp.]|uniref:hypothetical protein n=1 Tax=Phenylobacterium sp. TaxID=1871053 RepID=UPI0035ADD631|nr:hypothetical protein [Pseudomonadota bacterium]
MTHERFEILAHAYGGDIARWPAAERDAAALLMAAEPEFARIVLGDAGELDAALDLWAPLAVTATLREAVVASAPLRRWGLNAWFLRAGVGAGLAAACAAGLVVGVMLSDLAQATASDDTVSATLSNYDDLSGLVTLEGA